ncbi:hypothetical protein BCR35DRAFT_311543 [Leucosporidium creatinivorum]|uniref:Uncharacterized protein n=1 Tax=Leucosporidium creatinivorum TaxID=106004 RepID=A0A1Y2BSL8_9BASI|nr:hypothetical protein BCR35DRAFT_311543 [Leucosporidium creatinivorum]
MPAGRTSTPFTAEDRQLLAEYLSKEHPDHRLRPSVYKPIAAKHPHHTAESWMEHYKRTGREEIEWRIAKIKRKEKKARKAKKAAAIEAAAAVASSSKGKKRAREPSSTEEESEEESEEQEEESSEEEDEMPSRRPQGTKNPYTEKDYRRLVRYLARAREENKSNAATYADLAVDYPAHTASSWQTYHRDHKTEVDNDVYERLKRLKKERKELARKSFGGGASTSTPKAKAPRPSESPRRTSSAAAIPKHKNEPIVLRSSSPEVSNPKIKKAKLIDGRQPSAGPSSARKSMEKAKIEQERSEEEEDEEEDGEDEEEEEREPNPVFTEEDENLTIFCLAKVEVEDKERDDAWKYLNWKYKQHTAEEWKAHYIANKATLFPRVGPKVVEFLKNKARKLERKQQQEEAAERPKLDFETERKEDKAPRESQGKEKEVVVEDGEEVEVVVEKVVKEVVTVVESEDVEMADKAAPAQVNGPPAALLTSPSAQNPSPPTPKPTPPSSHSQPSQDQKCQPLETATTTSRAQPAAVPASSNSTDPEPSTQHSSLELKGVPPTSSTAPDGKDADGKDDAATLAAIDMQRQRSLPSPFIKADQYPLYPPPSVSAATTNGAPPLVNGAAPPPVDKDEEDDSHSLADSDDRRMDDLLDADADVVKAQAQPEKTTELEEAWLPLSAAQEALVAGVFEMGDWLREEEEMERVESEERERERRVAAAFEEEEKRKARLRDEARLRAEEEQQERARAAEVEQKRVEAEKKKQKQREEERRQREAEQTEKKEAARRRAEQAAELKRKNEAAAAAVEAKARAEAEAKAKAKAEEEVELKRKAAIKEGKKRMESTEAPSPAALKKSTARGSSAIPSPLRPRSTETPSRPIVASAIAPSSTTRKRVRDSTDGIDDDHPPPSGKKPRASLTASARKSSVSASASPAPAPVTRPRPSTTTTTSTRTLKEELSLRRDVYSLPKRGPHALYLAVSCPTDFTILDRACEWFSPTRGPSKGTAEYAELEKWVAKEVWSFDDDVIVLAGTEEAKEGIERRKGRKAVDARRGVLFSAGIEMVSQLKKGWPWAPK